MMIATTVPQKGERGMFAVDRCLDFINANGDSHVDIWQGTDDPHDSNPVPESGVIESSTLPRMTATMLRSASRSFKYNTVALDGWHPRHFELLSDRSLDALADLLAKVEAIGEFPTQQESLAI
eukprot:6121182-Karenia_brevis.AAC.1